ncbi:MAG: 16S rRNA (adenine(1518)-N(6)/adenine(1519)-N(6))-dimethyltransferase RsmA [Candidatus Omnitrophica bacterium]|jgi:16S rRNA (adenine1518-N6/adenine1519-N6)-dimethyltransferase|nr:16S rRNA (adenine(1518)-N(6)/adenine(1519)-N(6))-dimethyltransferase RsmA [Candidatus Omnitrophota bacterium]MDD5660420.1 16S rRNA (adenine(1518)-N(6)/adenine(1519)-N(6))-dimethyltransferase RsmA [Candidatus Omnitrophota bacterium]
MYIKPKKSLGQNFLIDKNIQRKIINACRLSKEDIILEIGSGRGELTSGIAALVNKVYALEIDSRIYPELEEKLSATDNCQVIKSDILKFDIRKFLQENIIKQKVKIIGNIPYYISSPIIEHLIGYRSNISEVFLTVQKEFGRRVAASSGSKEYGSFSCFVQYYAQTKILFEIKRTCFRPLPKVDSCFLSLKFTDKPLLEDEEEAGLFKLIRAAFNQRRKTLRNSLSAFISEGELEDFLNSSGIDKNVRPEDLSLLQFIELLKKVKKNLDKSIDLV